MTAFRGLLEGVREGLYPLKRSDFARRKTTIQRIAIRGNLPTGRLGGFGVSLASRFFADGRQGLAFGIEESLPFWHVWWGSELRFESKDWTKTFGRKLARQVWWLASYGSAPAARRSGPKHTNESGTRKFQENMLETHSGTQRPAGEIAATRRRKEGFDGE